jgi:hypothetical protein
LDVEQLWKQKQQKLVSVLPKPRFTQRDIIDKKVFIPSPSAKYQKTKRQKLLRTYSQPSLKIPIRRLSKTNTEAPQKSPKSCTRRDFIQYQKPKEEYRRTPSPVWEAMDNLSSSSSEGGDMPVRNSLDFLSYAIAITENNHTSDIPHPHEEETYSSKPLPDVSHLSPNLDDAPGEPSPPSSPVTSAAKAIMAFVNSQSDRPLYTL